MSIRHLAASASADDIAAALAEDGAAIVDALAPASLMDRAAEELQPYIAATGIGRDDFAGRRTRRTGGLIARSETCRDLVMNPLVLSATKKMLAHAATFQIHLTQVITIEPEAAAQPIHRDQWVFDFFKFPKGFEVQLNTIWAMTDFTAQNGATRVIPKSHLFDDGLKFEEKDTEPAEMAKGSVLFYTGSRLSRRRRQPLGHDSMRDQSNLQPLVVAAGGEPIPLCALRRRGDFADRIAAADGVLLRRLRAWIRGRRSRPD